MCVCVGLEMKAIVREKTRVVSFMQAFQTVRFL
jgi:hypothetical protein